MSLISAISLAIHHSHIDGLVDSIIEKQRRKLEDYREADWPMM